MDLGSELWPVVAALLGAGVLAGFLAGLLGIGGGVVTIPALFLALDPLGVPLEWRMHVAIATSLAIIIATNLSSVRAHHSRQGVDWGIVRRWWWLVAIGAILGSVAAKHLKTAELVYVFATLSGLLALKMVLPIQHWRLGTGLPKGAKGYAAPWVIGFFSSVMGIGGGSLSVPYMTLYDVPIHRAVGTASLLGLVISVAGGGGYLLGGLDVAGLPDGQIGFVNWPAALVVAAAAALMAPIGARAAHALPRAVLSVVFGLFLIAATVRLLVAVH
ncbi:sulfite exporter TauE/SafE family protein [Yunchengibacter salinarum]|uniref:sulfite exporter TauE/SafE family protein n=1 Tax=Yunchengibacter salinarum TaxID=3133399 RepID=UPI0035B6542C